ncbi:MAG: PEP-utilizing enzyme, partial [Chloroflexota bacterium]
ESAAEDIPNREWTRGSYPEFLPDVPSPFFGSLLERTQEQAIDFFRNVGLTVDDLGPYMKLIIGRPYLNLSFLKRIIAQVGIAPGNLLYTIGYTEPGAIRGNLSIDWESAWRERSTLITIIQQLFKTNRVVRAYEILVKTLTRKIKQTDFSAPPTEILGQFRHHDQIYGQLLLANLCLTIDISALIALASRLIAPFNDTPAVVITTLALQNVNSVDSQINKALYQLSQKFEKDEAIVAYFRNAPDDFSDYDNNPNLSSAFRSAFDHLLDTFGQRAPYDTDLGYPRYQDDPKSLLQIIRQNLHLLATESHEATDRDGSPLTLKKALQRPKGLNQLIPWQRWGAAFLIKRLQNLFIQRERLNQAGFEGLTAYRQWDLQLSQQWVSQGWLIQPQDIFWLTMDEIERTLMVGQTMGVTLSSTVQARKETYELYEQTPLPHTLQETQIAAIQLGIGLTTDLSSDALIGLPISPGQVRGTIKVITDPKQFETSREDDILVMPSTDPAWLSLLHFAAGLIVETGGLLSHGSIIAREYGIPAVANIPSATRRFQDGDQVLVDGSTGVIQLLD